jgi:hypothetical protein
MTKSGTRQYFPSGVAVAPHLIPQLQAARPLRNHHGHVAPIDRLSPPMPRLTAAVLMCSGRCPRWLPWTTVTSLNGLHVP